MLRFSSRRVAGLSGIVLAALLALPTVASAGSPGTIAQTGGMSATLPILGASLSVDITLDSTGHLSQVNLDPVGTYTATKLGAHAVSFDSSDGATRVKIRSTGDKLSVKAAATTLDSLLGSGTWSADVFGTSEKSSVAYTVGKAADGSPTVAIDSVSAAAGITATSVPASSRASKGGSTASAGVDFARNGFVKHLVIRVSVKAGGSHPASLGITLSGKDRQRLAGTLESIMGDHAWAGLLCDGTAVSATFNVASDGTVTVAATTGAPATSGSFPGGTKVHGRFGGSDERGDAHGIKGARDAFVSGALVRFTGTRTKVAATVLKLADGSYVFTIVGRGGECHAKPGTPPKVNTPVDPKATQADTGIRLAGTGRHVAQPRRGPGHVNRVHGGHSGSGRGHGGRGR